MKLAEPNLDEIDNMQCDFKELHGEFMSTVSQTTFVVCGAVAKPMQS